MCHYSEKNSGSASGGRGREEGGEMLTRYPIHHKHMVNQTQRRILFPSGVLLHCRHNTDQGPTNIKYAADFRMTLGRPIIT